MEVIRNTTHFTNDKNMELNKTHHLIEKRECGICLDDIRTDNLASAPCGHQFCFTCILRAFCTSNECPYCRREFIDMPSEDDSDEEYEEEDEADDNRTVDSSGWETVSDSEEDDEEDEPEQIFTFSELKENELFGREDINVAPLCISSM